MISAFSLIITIAVIIFTVKMSGNVGYRARSLQTLASSFIMMGVPTLLLLAMCASQGKWADFFLVCGLISAWAIGSVFGYGYAKARPSADPFFSMFIGGLIALPIVGTPLAIYMIP